MSDPARDIPEGARLARRAVELGKDDAVALTRAGHALGHLAGDIEGGIALLDRAALLNPNLAAAWFLSGASFRAWRGNSEGAIEHFTRAMRLSPLDLEIYRMQAGMAVAHLFARRFDAAASWAEKSFRELPSFLMVVSILAASQARRRPEGGSAASDGASAPPRSGLAHLQSPGVASDPPARGSRRLYRWPAKGRAAGVKNWRFILFRYSRLRVRRRTYFDDCRCYFLPPPPADRKARALRGEGRGGGGRILNNAIDAAGKLIPIRRRGSNPHPSPPPQGGRGYKGNLARFVQMPRAFAGMTKREREQP